ncbi:GGDEF domain-containing protein [Desulforhopalus vacuolatus]|uniref:GGDEF domain-containing protein n=1 Tax=Desulforhopalus vacuolatus TaxID=40414 RepID=UPI0019668656|nr:GGDEF domain-containing protein [Desulforhopalus vacuolatus]MBM9520052.1 GGDEF domain-containing protein [Desulforhopalus vacuolatus]
MKYFQWGSHFVTGLAEVDKQHHHLVDIINKFSNLLAENLIHIEDVDCLYNQLADYAVYHFQEEEKLMLEARVNASHLKHHIDIHKSFLDDVTSIYSSISIDNLDQASTFLNFLIHWLAYHILGEDQNMTRQIKAIQYGMSPHEAYEKMKQERYNATVPLLEALNGLFEQVSIRNKELKQLNESLEEKVALRTKELSEANLYFEELALTDVLTGLPNRRHAMQSLSRIWDESLQKDSSLVCMMIDADNFKEVNDTYGHDAGDEVLIKLAKTLQHSLRNDDFVYRLGGDEFFAICPDTDIEGGIHIAEITRKTVSELRIPTGREAWHGSISVGVASRLPDMKSYKDLIKEADKGLYAAKKAGKNCTRTANDTFFKRCENF